MGLLEEASRRVQTAIDGQSNEIVDFLSEYLRHRSVNPMLENGPGEKDCQDWLKRQLDSWKSFDLVESWEIAKGRPNVVGVLKGSGGGRDLMFNGHSDVVPVAKEDAPNWTTDPWGGEVKNGRVYGRGATDMKSGITAFLWASRLVADNGIRLKGSVINAVTIAEESGEHRLGVDSVMDRGYTADFLVNAEPTNAVICPAGVGILLFRIKVFGKGGHTSMKWKGLSKRADPEEDLPGVNAIEKMMKFVSAFEELEARWMNTKKHPLMPRGASNITLSVIKGGEYLGRIPGYCEADFLAWTAPGEPTSRSMEEINRVIARVSRSDAWLRRHPPIVEPAAPELPNGCEPYNLPLDDPAVRTIGEAYTKALKKRKTAWGAFTAVGETIWMKERGIPGLVFGPGELTMGSHGNDEYVPIEQLIDCCRVYAEMMLRWCGVAEVGGAERSSPGAPRLPSRL